jgi:sulfur-oxidizing protein SoxX
LALGQWEEILKFERYVLPLLGVTVLAIAGMAAPAIVAADELVNFTIIDGESIPDSLTGKAGDPVKGRETAIHRKKGNCLACHALPAPEQPYHGEVGPDLNEVAGRLSEGEIRLRIVNPKYANPATIMPAFYKTEGLHMVQKKWQGKPMLTAEEVEDIVAYLMTLKE